MSQNVLGIGGYRRSYCGGISPNGQFVLVNSKAGNLVLGGDTSRHQKAFVVDRQSKIVQKVSASSDGVGANDWSTATGISADGGVVTFESSASNLVDFDSNGRDDVFVFHRWDGLGSNALNLQGPLSINVSQKLKLEWSCPKPNLEYWLGASVSNSGSIIDGHTFDLGPEIRVLSRGFVDSLGGGRFHSAPVPSSLAGMALYLEVGATDGVIHFDSNLKEIQVH